MPQRVCGISISAQLIRVFLIASDPQF